LNKELDTYFQTKNKVTYFCLDTKVAKDQAEVFKTGSLILR